MDALFFNRNALGDLADRDRQAIFACSGLLAREADRSANCASRNRRLRRRSLHIDRVEYLPATALRTVIGVKRMKAATAECCRHHDGKSHSKKMRLHATTFTMRSGTTITRRGGLRQRTHHAVERQRGRLDRFLLRGPRDRDLRRGACRSPGRRCHHVGMNQRRVAFGQACRPPVSLCPNAFQQVSARWGIIGPVNNTKVSSASRLTAPGTPASAAVIAFASS